MEKDGGEENEDGMYVGRMDEAYMDLMPMNLAS